MCVNLFVFAFVSFLLYRGHSCYITDVIVTRKLLIDTLPPWGRSSECTWVRRRSRRYTQQLYAVYHLLFLQVLRTPLGCVALRCAAPPPPKSKSTWDNEPAVGSILPRVL